MNDEPQFLSFKGLKQYTPDVGWVMMPHLTRPVAEPLPKSAPPDNIPTLTQTAQLPQDAAPELESLTDPLMTELFAQLQSGPSDELTQGWCRIAAQVSQLSQHLAQQRALQEQLVQLEQDMHQMRQGIQRQLQQVQQAAEQQLTSARLRTAVSALARNKLALRLSNT